MPTFRMPRRSIPSIAARTVAVAGIPVRSRILSISSRSNFPPREVISGSPAWMIKSTPAGSQIVGTVEGHREDLVELVSRPGIDIARHADEADSVGHVVIEAVSGHLDDRRTDITDPAAPSEQSSLLRTCRGRISASADVSESPP